MAAGPGASRGTRVPKRAPIAISRRFTDTPLARQHDHETSGRTSRRIPAIPWSRFDRSRYPLGALELAADAQRALALGEYGAIDLFARIASGLCLCGAPLDLVTAAARIPADEARHADYALRMAGLCKGGDAGFELDPAPLAALWRDPIDMDRLDAVMVEVAAITETLAAAFIGACRERATDPVVRALFTSIVGDEIHHARLGWYYLAWRSPQWTRPERQRAADVAARVIVDVEPTFWRGRDAPRGCGRAARALGVLDSKGQRVTLRRVMQDEIVPALDAFGLGATHAWRARRRGA